jgi:hypothetical protein
MISPGSDQLFGVGGIGGQHAGYAQNDHAGQHDPFPAETVGQRPHGQQHAGQHQDVGVDDPLQAGRRRAQLSLQRGYRRIHNDRIDNRNQQPHGQHRKRPPPQPVFTRLPIHRSRIRLWLHVYLSACSQADCCIGYSLFPGDAVIISVWFRVVVILDQGAVTQPYAQLSDERFHGGGYLGDRSYSFDFMGQEV